MTTYPENIDQFIQDPWTLMLMGIVIWYACKWLIYAKQSKVNRRAFSFREWRQRTQYNVLFSLFCLYFMIAWDDEIIAKYFTGREYEEFSDVIYLATGPVSSVLWYVTERFNDVVAGVFKFVLGKFVR